MSDEYIKKEDIIKFIEDIKCNKDVPKNYGTLLDIMRYIRKMPTYDVDKVVQKITELQLKIKDKSLLVEDEEYAVMLRGQLRGIADCLEIVKSGGVADE